MVELLDRNEVPVRRLLVSSRASPSTVGTAAQWVASRAACAEVSCACVCSSARAMVACASIVAVALVPRSTALRITP